MLMSANILLVEDNTDIAELVISHLEAKSYVMDYAKDGLTASHLAATNTYDLIILDVMLPGIDGLALCRSFREQINLATPVIMLTARDTLDDKVQGFNSGADDYLVKPFSVVELESRIKAQLRRSKNEWVQNEIVVEDLKLDTNTLTVKRQEKEISLTPTNFKLLTLLMRSSPSVVRRQDIERHIWGDTLPDSDTLRSHMYNLRKCVDKPFEKKLIKTHQSSGYQIVA